MEKLARHRNLDMVRFKNLLMKEKTIALPYEDPITFGMNAAKPLIDAMSAEERDRIEMVISCTESAFDFGKSMSEVHDRRIQWFQAWQGTVLFAKNSNKYFNGNYHRLQHLHR